MMFMNSRYNDIDKEILQKADAAALKSVLKLIPFGQLTSVICAIILLLVFNHIPSIRLWNLGFVVGIITTAAIWIRSAYIDVQKNQHLEMKIILKHMLLAGISSGLFSIQVTYLYQYAIGIESVFLGCLLVGMIAAGSFMLSSYQYIAWVWVVVLGASPIFILLHQGSFVSIIMIIPIISFYALIVNNVTFTYNLFIELKVKEEQLKNALKLSEDAIETKSQFLANMSHEIRTPMNAVIGLAYLALKTDLSDKQRDYISKIHNAANSLLGVINDILDSSKIESGNLEIENINFVLNDVITNAVALISQDADEKEIEIICHVPFDIPQNLIGDPLRLGQVITNILSNAVKFTSSGEISIDIESISDTSNKIKLQFKIKDTGIGMRKEELENLFKAFTQADSSTTRIFGGTGLGLAISSKLVQMMGGSLYAQSEVSMGSTFTFTAWFEKIYNIESKSSIIPESISNMKMLVVDDNNAARQICIEYLKAMNFITDAAPSGEDAIGIIKRADSYEPYDVIFIDWKMEGMNGIELAKEIQDSLCLTNIPAVVLVTAFDKEELTKRAINVKIDDFLVKPISQSMLYDCIVKLFSLNKEVTLKSKVIAQSNYNLSGIKVLLVEDNEINQQIEKELLESEGIIVETAINGAEAVNMIGNIPNEIGYNIVLMDLQMPEMDGFEATRIIREKDKKLPIIAMTARAMLEEREKCFKAGMNDHISKPIDPNILFSTISNWTPDTFEKSNSLKIEYVKDKDCQISSVIQIKGIDVETGLKRVANNEKLYVNLLLKYSENHTKTVIKLWEAIRQNDLLSAERLAHTLNGVSGNIGATKVQSLACNLENIFKTSSNVENIKPIMYELDVLVAKISKDIKDKISDRTDSKTNEKIISNLQFTQKMSKLHEMLMDSDSEAVDYFIKIKSQISTFINSSELFKITLFIKKFEYNEAISIVETILENIAKRDISDK